MKPFTTLTSIAAPIDRPNVDTDQIAPIRFLRRPRTEGYQDVLFHDLRFSAPGAERPDFILNRPEYRSAKILVADRNFGGGSSREQAVWALSDYGIRCVIAVSFGDIFYNNSVKHGLLLIRLDADAAAGLRAQLNADPGASMTIDLDAQSIVAPDGSTIRFDIEPGRKKQLLLGLDEVQLTLQHDSEIAAFDAAYRKRKPWLFRARAKA
jgi:3-isopropylmalate/(R)-2-methylmalate dehydratase small subunit